MSEREKAVEALARKRWNGRRAEIIESGTAAYPGKIWDEIQPNPKNGQDVRASERNRAWRDLEDIEPILRSQIASELGERAERAEEALPHLDYVLQICEGEAEPDADKLNAARRLCDALSPDGREVEG